MKKKLLDLLENHIDKLILCVLGILALAIVWIFNLSNPYAAEANRKKNSPGEIDTVIMTKAKSLSDKINGEATVAIKPIPRSSAKLYMDRLDTTVKILDDIRIPIPSKKTVVKKDKRSYQAPVLPPLTDIVADSLRTAVFMPTLKVDSEKTYDQVDTEVEDIDFISVQASFNTAELYNNYERSFSGKSVPISYRDEELATPVFAALKLERQQLLKNGQWSEWKKVPPTKIDSRFELFNIPSKVSDIELGGIDLLLLNFDKFDIMADLLQPQPYDIAASNAEWLCPKYHIELTKIFEEQAKEERLRMKGKPTRRQPVRGNTAPEMGMGMDMGMQRNPRLTSRLARTREAKSGDGERTESDIYSDQEFMTITEDLDLSSLREPIFVWAHDDKVVPGNTYRYRMRLGVFNPVAGKGWLEDSDAKFNDDIIFWTDYTEPSNEIEIDPMMYIFPVELVQGRKIANIQISKFMKGKWQSETFEVRPGEEIGKEVEVSNENTLNNLRRIRSRNTKDEIETLDFTTGAKLVDIVKKDSDGTSRRPVFEIQYTFDGQEILTMPIASRNWDKEIANAFEEIELDKDVEVTISENRVRGGRRSRPGLQPQLEDMEMMEMMMMEGMGGPGF